ncbi:MAG: hypothetical protein N3D71_02195 [Burkholderiaceae bacterium]|nr:hypothetical protein [Burkholderiaceae bacterium]
MLKPTLAAAFAALISIAGPAGAVGSITDVRVVDRTTGQTLPMYRHQGRWWVAGIPGNRYAIALANRSGARVLTVISVDGVNAVSGEMAAWEQVGYVLARGQRTQITGWRKSTSRVAAFEFVALPDAYAARTGRPAHVGVIGVAIFRERSKPISIAPPARSSEPAAGSAPASPATGGESASNETHALKEDDRLGTGHGRSETSHVTYTEFERAQSAPDEIVTIHYDSHANLVAMGVIPSPRPQPNPFPGSQLGFVPDPPR